MKKIAINGFGRIGRLAFRELQKNDQLEIVAINDLTAPSMLAYLLKYDSAHGKLESDISSDDHHLIVDGKKIIVLQERDPQNLPWKELGIDIVLESTGFFASKEKATAHIEAGAKKVLISAPAGQDLKTIVYNVNHETLNADDTIISNASCTTNCLAPMAQVLHDAFEITAGQMTTIHAHTTSQPLLDLPNAKGNLRGARAAGSNIVPYTTGAAKAIGLVIPELQGKLDGSSQRVPVMTGSIVELFTILQQEVTVEMVNAAMKANSNDSYGYTEEHLVSSDIIGMEYGALFDATQTKIVSMGGQQLVKTVAWYDNEMSFVKQLVRTLEYFGEL